MTTQASRPKSQEVHSVFVRIRNMAMMGVADAQHAKKPRSEQNWRLVVELADEGLNLVNGGGDGKPSATHGE